MTYYFSYVRRLKPFEKPDYELLKKFFKGLIQSSKIQQEGFKLVLKFDWVMLVVDKVVKRRMKNKKDADDQEDILDDLEIDQVEEGQTDCDFDGDMISEVLDEQNDSLRLLTNRLERSQE